jgi:hypothetical protein
MPGPHEETYEIHPGRVEWYSEVPQEFATFGPGAFYFPVEFHCSPIF